LDFLLILYRDLELCLVMIVTTNMLSVQCIEADLFAKRDKFGQMSAGQINQESGVQPGHRPLRRPSIRYFDGIACVRPKARAAPPAEYPAVARRVWGRSVS
jgi:hypothetical protein